MIRYKMSIEYDGSLFRGWQRQPDVLTIQEVIENSLFKICQQKIDITCAGRTDTGVHALEQIAHFDMEKDFSSFTLQQALNFHLKNYNVSVFNIEKFLNTTSFHARFSAKSREYIYKITNRRHPLTFDKNKSWWIPQPLDLKAMESASQHLIGTYDFSSFRAKGCQANSPIRTIDKISFSKEGESLISMHIVAPSFLYHQVRNIIGTLYLVGTDRITSNDLIIIRNQKDRNYAGITAPPYGLYFYKVNY